MSKEKAQKIYRKGLPISADVIAIQKKYPNLKPGDVITYSELEKIIGVPYKSNRFNTVVTAWRKLELKENGRSIGCINTVGYYVENPEQIIDRTPAVIDKATRQFGTQISKLNTIPASDPINGPIAIHQIQKLNGLVIDARNVKTAIEPPSAADTGVQITPPRLVRKA